MPFWIEEPVDVNSSEEEDAEFHCQAGGVPNPDIMWSINGVPISGTLTPRALPSRC